MCLNVKKLMRKVGGFRLRRSGSRRPYQFSTKSLIYIVVTIENPFFVSLIASGCLRMLPGTSAQSHTPRTSKAFRTNGHSARSMPRGTPGTPMPACCRSSVPSPQANVAMLTT